MLVGVIPLIGALVLLIWPDPSLVTLALLAGWTLIIFGLVHIVTSLRRRGSARIAGNPAT